MTEQSNQALREEIVDTCRAMNAMGLNQGTSGNISVKLADGDMLISPSGVTYDRMSAADIVHVGADGTHEERTDDMVASSEWRFHLAILTARPAAAAVVHNHSMYATILSACRQSIPAVHYMIAAAGGPVIRCADYATYGTQELADNALQALAGRHACLLANHGVIAVGNSLAAGLRLAKEVEVLAQQHVFAKLLGGPVLLSDEEIGKVVDKFKSYGPKS